MRKVILTLLISVLTLSVFSQAVSKNDKIKELLNLSGSGKLGEQVAKSMIFAFQSQFTNVDQQFWEEFAKEIKSEDLINMIIPIYDKYFNEEDIDQLISFYKTPIGKKMIETLPQISQESMLAGQNWGRQLGEKVERQLTAKGYLKK